MSDPESQFDDLTPEERATMLRERYPDTIQVMVTPEVVTERTKALWDRPGAWSKM